MRTDSVRALTNLADAHDDIEARQMTGKVDDEKS